MRSALLTTICNSYPANPLRSDKMRKYGVITSIALIVIEFILACSGALFAQNGNNYALAVIVCLFTICLLFISNIAKWAVNKDYPPKSKEK